MADLDIVVCADCAAEVQATDIPQIAYIKHREWLCDDCYRLRREEGR